MNAIDRDLQGLRMGEALAHEALAAHPLIRESLNSKDYLTLDEALRLGTARVTEVSEDGSVPHLLFSNRADQAVFLLDGEELVGAKQNRVLNITILAPAAKDTILPVSCVEAGRWRHTSSEFRSAPRAQYSESRARKAGQVSASLAANRGARSDQGEVWSDIEGKLGRMRSHSATRAVEQVFEDHESKLARFVDGLPCVRGQVGAVFSIRGRPVGMEMFDSAETCVLLMPKIIRSYALDAIDPGYRPPGSQIGSPGDLVERLRDAAYSSHQAAGEGNDLRFEPTPGIAGGALHARDRIVHLCAFVTAERRARGDGNGYRYSASMRRRFRNVA
ncbi:MAG: hypothetical protein GWM87_07685 [Xanthomonadales bacterium]|nr:hypothetical protein [Xanthomonadales bacterium]NIX12825.1 hypothetical protein [Xanthomonadales bacterium]